MRRLSSDGWRKFLTNFDKRDTRSFFAYLAKSEGRKTWGFVPADASPLLDEHQNEVASHSGKLNLITATFRRKFAAPTRVNPQSNSTDPNGRPLPPFTERMKDSFAPIQPVEMQKAIQQLSSNKAPGPDGVPTDIYTNLPSLLPYLTKLANEIYRTGFIPKR